MYSDDRLSSWYMEIGEGNAVRRHAIEAIKKNPNWPLRQVRFDEPNQDEDNLEFNLDLPRRAGLPE